MKKTLLVLSTLLNMYSYAQQVPTANNPGGPPSGQGSGMYWSRSGNTLAGGNNNSINEKCKKKSRCSLSFIHGQRDLWFVDNLRVN